MKFVTGKRNRVELSSEVGELGNKHQQACEFGLLGVSVSCFSTAFVTVEKIEFSKKFTPESIQIWGYRASDTRFLAFNQKATRQTINWPLKLCESTKGLVQNLGNKPPKDVKKTRNS